MTRTTLLAAIMTSVIAIGTAGLAYAEEQGDQLSNESAIIANAKVTMAQAIAAAEQQVGGKAVGAGIEDQDGTVSFEVQILKGDNTMHKVLVDTQTGKVVKTVADNGNDEGEHEGNKGDDHEGESED